MFTTIAFENQKKILKRIKNEIDYNRQDCKTRVNKNCYMKFVLEP